ncbi:MAG: MFS transporter [Gammaproteobacteria bacterium]|nr:MFS transporter [Gammaproteobacteria bacterium]
MPNNSGQGDVSRSIAIFAFSLGALYFSYAFVQRVSPSVMTSELMRDFGVGGALLGTLSAFYFYTYAVIQMPVGMLTDRFGPRKLMSFALVVCALATVGFALSPNLLSAIVLRSLIGGSVAFAFVGTMAIAGYWFNHNRNAFLAGILQTLGMLGAVFAQASLRSVVESIGWRNTMHILAVIAAVLALLIYFGVPKRTRSQRQVASYNFREAFKSAAWNRQTWLCATIGFGMCATMLSFSGLWAVPWLTTVHGYTPTRASAMASALFLGWAVTAPAVGWISDHIGRRNVLPQIGAVLYILVFLVIVYFTPDSELLLVLLIFLCGAFGSSVTVCFTVVREHNNASYASTALGLMNMFVVGSGAVMQPTIGWLLDVNWKGVMVDGARIYDAEAYAIGFSSLLVVMVLALISTFVLKETYCRSQDSDTVAPLSEVYGLASGK